MGDRLRVGVVGCGIGRAHIRAYQGLGDLFDVVAVCDIDEGRAIEVAEEHNIPRVLTDLGELCELADLDVIDVCTPSYLHAPQVQQVLLSGKHAVCEKPVAGSLREIDGLIAAEARSGVRAMPIYQSRFGHGVQKLKVLRDAGVSGRAYFTTVETAWRRRAAYYAVPWRGKWETELGGALVTLAIHAHDLLYYVLGPVKTVVAQAATLVNPIETEDSVAASLRMADGSLATLSVTTGSAAEISRHRFCFSNLTAESNTQPYRSTTDPWVFTGESPEATTRIEESLATYRPLPEGFEGQFYRFHEALRRGVELPVTLADARASLELITAIYHSAETGCAVHLPLGHTHPKYADWRPKGLWTQTFHTDGRTAD